MLRRLSIRGKILVALAMPLLVLALAAVYIALPTVQEAKNARDLASVTDLIAPQAALIRTLEAEREASVAAARGDSAGRFLAGAQNNTDMALAKLNVAYGSLDQSLFDGVIAQLAADAEGLGTAIFNVRSGVLGTSDSAIDAGYTQLIFRLAAMPTTLADSVEDSRLTIGLRAYGATLSAHEWLIRERSLATVALQDPENQAAVISQLSAIVATTDLQLATATDAATRAGLRLTISYKSLQEAEEINALGSGNIERVATVHADAYEAWADRVLAEVESAETQLVTNVLDTAADADAAAQRELYLTVGVAGLVLLLSLVAAILIARQITRPLRRLIRAAGQVRDDLPRLVEQVAVPGQAPDLSIAEIPVDTHDEVGKLATAFNEVNATTLQVAQEQAALRGSIAEMFVNVARRDQVLLNRQLTFIDALERSEEDPKILADLFRLDHLATRMRRNAESLLVLAGIDTGRRLRETLPLSDVVRTAASEIEHYERVVLELPVDPMMLGHTALPAAHLMAELLENAATFSEPGSPVYVSTGRDGTHVVVSITDQGLGMSAEDREAAQAKIRSSSASEVLGAQRLGFFVVGRLAARLGAQIELTAGPHGTGTVATIRLPLVLFVDVADVPMASPSLPWDVEAPVALEAPEPEVVRAVDLDALTDGATGQGLPRRRTAKADVEAPAPSAAATAADEWTPTLAEGAPLAGRRGGAAQPVEATPVEAIAPVIPISAEVGAGLPVAAADTALEEAIEEAPGAPEADSPAGARAAVFSGFRSRRDVHRPPTSEQPVLADPTSDLEQPVEPVAPAAAFGSVPEPTIAPFVIPLLEEDEEEPWQPAVMADQPLVVPVLEEEEEWLPEPDLHVSALAQGTDEVDLADPLLDDDEHWADLPVAFAGDTGWPPVEPPAALPQVAPLPPVAPLPAAFEPVAFEPAASLPVPAEPVQPAPVAVSVAGPAALAAADGQAWTESSDADFATLIEGTHEQEGAIPAAKPRRGGWLFGRSKRGKAEPTGESHPVQTAAPALAPAAPAAYVPPAPEPVAPVVPVAPAVPVAAAAHDAWAPSWSPTEPSVAPVDASSAFADLAKPLSAPAPQPAPQAAWTPSEVEQGASSTAGMQWTPDVEVADPAPNAPWRLPIPGEPDWPGARLAQGEPEPAPAPAFAPAFEPAPAPVAPAFGQDVETPRHVKPVVPSQHTAAVFVPTEDAAADSSVSQRAGIAQQALAELSQLSTYRPQSVGAPSAPLTRRTPTPIPQTAATTPTKRGTPRDANQVRSLLASFQSGTGRGREQAGTTVEGERSSR